MSREFYYKTARPIAPTAPSINPPSIVACAAAPVLVADAAAALEDESMWSSSSSPPSSWSWSSPCDCALQSETLAMMFAGPVYSPTWTPELFLQLSA